MAIPGLYLLQLFADLHPVFADCYFHHVDSDGKLVCEMYEVVQQTAYKVTDPELSTPLEDSLFHSLYIDSINNIKAESQHYTKVKRHNTLSKMKIDLLKKKQ